MNAYTLIQSAKRELIRRRQVELAKQTDNYQPREDISLSECVHLVAGRLLAEITKAREDALDVIRLANEDERKVNQILNVIYEVEE